MASIADIVTKMMLKLKLTNFAESLPESKTRLHVRRISFVVTILDDKGSGADDVVVNHAEPPSPEYQQILNWQAEPEDLQDDVTVRDSLTQLSGRLCPYRNIETSIFDKVKSDEDTKQMHPLSSYRHLSFRSAMLTRHVTTDDDGLADGQPELLFLYDGLGGDQSFFRWRSNYIPKVTLRKPRPWFRVFWLIQWDIVDLLQRTGSPYDTAATNQGKRRRSPSFHQLQGPLKRPDHNSEKFRGVRLRKKRKSPWAAELRRKGKKIWLGNYKTPEAAARAADAGSFYYDRCDRLNFRDSPQFLARMPQVLSDESKLEFVKIQAHLLAEKTEMQPSQLPSTWDPYNRTSCTANPADTRTAQPATTQATIAKGSPNSGVDVPLQDSMRDSSFTDLNVHPASTSHGGEHTHGSGCSTPEDLWLSSPCVSPIFGICSSREAANYSLCDDLPSSLWDEDLVQVISGDIAVKSAPSEIWADHADDISGHWSLSSESFQ